MKLCRFTSKRVDGPRYGLIDGSTLFPLHKDYVIGASGLSDTEDGIPIDEVKLLPPVVPSKIVCVGRNYLEHAAELGNKMPEEPLLFLKAPSSVIGIDDQIVIPKQSQQVEHEGELGVVVSRKATKISDEDNPLHYVLGYTCVNDVTARDIQRKDVQFTRGKSFDTFCSVGPWIVDPLDPTDLTVSTRVNGELKQHGNTADMAFSVSFLLRYISSAMTLYPGDLIATGTPAGVSRMKDGDVVEVEVEGIGILRNKVYDPARD